MWVQCVPRVLWQDQIEEFGTNDNQPKREISAPQELYSVHVLSWLGVGKEPVPVPVFEIEVQMNPYHVRHHMLHAMIDSCHNHAVYPTIDLVASK